jgi:hypothetical protein
VENLAGEVVEEGAEGDAWTGNNGASDVDGGDSCSLLLAGTGRSEISWWWYGPLRRQQRTSDLYFFIFYLVKERKWT